MELSVRLQAVADMVSKGRRVADIGCDHGYVSIYLYRQRQCERVIAMDVKKGPLERATTNIKRYGLSEYIDVRLSDGTAALQPGEVDTLLMSGMGGRLTIRILEEGFARLGRFEELVLQPQSELFLVRAFLRQQGIKIVDENMVVDDGKFYTVIKAQPMVQDESQAVICVNAQGESKYRQIVEDYFWPVLLKKRPEAFLMYLQKESEKTKQLLEQVTKQERRDELQTYLSYVEEAL